MIEAGELGEIRHFRGRYLQDWADDPTLATWRFDAAEAGSGALGDLGTHVIELGRFLNGEIATGRGLAKTFVAGRQLDDAIAAAAASETGATFEAGYRASEVGDAIINSGRTGQRVTLAYRSL